jgi:hypothetical protein
MPTIAAFALRPYMSTHVRVLSRIRAEEFAVARRDFPDPQTSSYAFLERRTRDISGRPVIVTFKRHQFRNPRLRAASYTWCVHSARYASPSEDA